MNLQFGYYLEHGVRFHQLCIQMKAVIYTTLQNSGFTHTRITLAWMRYSVSETYKYSVAYCEFNERANRQKYSFSLWWDTPKDSTPLITKPSSEHWTRF